MTADLSRLLNAWGLVALDTVLVLAFADQLWFRDLPCPICILQRAGFIAAGFGLALNLMFGPRPSHYGLAVMGALVGGSFRRTRCCITSSRVPARMAMPSSDCTSTLGR